jgi:hypothetical protein
VHVHAVQVTVGPQSGWPRTVVLKLRSVKKVIADAKWRGSEKSRGEGKRVEACEGGGGLDVCGSSRSR